jgi:hypothetical protein
LADRALSSAVIPAGRIRASISSNSLAFMGVRSFDHFVLLLANVEE